MGKEKFNEPTDQNFSIENFRGILKKFVADRQWETYHTPRALAEAISIEAGELLENFLFQPEGHLPENLAPLTDEMADVFIYLMNLVNCLDLSNFTQIVLHKIQKNAEKYPIEKYSGENYQKQ